MEQSLPDNPEKYDHFSLPLPLCLLGERQELLGLGYVGIASTLRIHMAARPTEEEFAIDVIGGAPSEALQDACSRWWHLLQEEYAPEGGSLHGLKLALDPGALAGAVEPAAVVRSPVFAAGAACSLNAYGRRERGLRADAVARQVSALMARFEGEEDGTGLGHYPAALLSLVGGAHRVSPNGETLDLQELMPPECLLLAVRPGLGPATGDDELHRTVRSALKKMESPAEALGEGSGEGLEKFYDLANEYLDDRETMAVYGLLRTRQLISALVEELSRPTFDHDVLAEMCEEEASLLAEHMGFPAEHYRDIGDKATEAGAIGFKYTYGPGGYPCMLVLAPGRRDAVDKVLRSEFQDIFVSAVDVDQRGLYSEPDPFRERRE